MNSAEIQFESRKEMDAFILLYKNVEKVENNEHKA